MAEIQISTTQNVTINFKAAEIGERILANIIDWFIKFAYIFLIGFLFSIGSRSINQVLDDNFGSDYWSIMAIGLVLFSPIIFYTIVLETLLMGQTLGKKIVKIRVIKIDGYRASFLDYFIRWGMRIIDTNFLFGVIGLVTMGSSKNHQRFGGMASGTAVITLKNKIGINHTILEETKEDYQPTYFSVIKLSDNDVRIIKENFIQARKTRDIKTMLILKQKIVDVIEEKPDPTSTTETFIKTIISDYNHFTKNM